MSRTAKRLAAALLMLLWFAPPGSASSDSRLTEAIKAGDRQTILTLLKSKVDVNAPDGQHATPLHWAVYQDDMDTADLLIRAGARVDLANDYGVTPLWLACENRNGAMVRKLLRARANPNAALSTGETVLMTCARTGDPAAIKGLLEAGANVNAAETLRGQTALMWAVAQRHPDIVQLLIEAGADVRRKTNAQRAFVANGVKGTLRGTSVGVDYDRGGFSPLLFAARQGDVPSARLLIAAGASVNETAADGASVLTVASLGGHTQLAEFLLKNGADPNAVGAGYPALHAAVLRGDHALVEALVARGANPNAVLINGTPVPRLSYEWFLSSTLAGITPYLLAAKFAEPEIMQTLATAGADIKVTLQDGTTALMAAAGVGSPSDRRSRILTDETVTEDDRRALQAVEIAIALGGDVNATNQAGDTALHGAALKGYQSVVDLLVSRGGQMGVKNVAGRTPAELLQRARAAGGAQL